MSCCLQQKLINHNGDCVHINYMLASSKSIHLYNTAFVIYTLRWGTVNKQQHYTSYFWHFFGLQLSAQNSRHAVGPFWGVKGDM